MPDYSKAKIYQIISPNHPLPYIGSTTQPLCKRMVGHRKKGNDCSSRIVIDAGDAYIELIEEYPCENKEQLNRREGELIRQRECVNRLIAGRTYNEWREDNREAIRAKQKAYQINKANRMAINYWEKNYQPLKKATATVDVLQEQAGQEDRHSEPAQAPQPL